MKFGRNAGSRVLCHREVRDRDGGTYNGTAFVASGSAVGSDGSTPVAGSFTYTYYVGSTATGTPLAGAPTGAGT
jgi:hypothetical protein